MNKRTELVWAAGFYDGEGSTCIARRLGYRSIKMTISQVEQAERCLREYEEAQERLTRRPSNHFRAYEEEKR